MAELILGPVLRYVSETEATIWVETDSACEVEILGTTEPTFEVASHHYALVRIEDLEPGSFNAYEVALDGETRWPLPNADFPPSAIRTLGRDKATDICFGSCRVALPHHPPFADEKDNHKAGREYDALRVLAIEMLRSDRDKWPELLFLLGDQIYVDEGSPQTRAKIRARRGTLGEPGEEVVDFEEYTWLYQESWADPKIRWLMSTISISMIWDDHDMSDDWNISHQWLEEMRQRPWWHGRVTAGMISYFIYQHLGNLSPRELDDLEIYGKIRGNRQAGNELSVWASKIDQSGAGTRWSFCRDIGDTRAIFIDSRAGRVLEPDRRAMVDDEEWDWLVEHATGDFDHLLIATTIPVLLSPGFHYLEAWSERVCHGAWGDTAATLCERLRQAVDFDHWGSFGESFDRLRRLFEEIGTGKRGKPPASIVILSGDVHHAYLAEAGFKPGTGMQTPVYQAVCSPYRNPLDDRERAAIKIGFTRPFTALMRKLAESAGVPDPELRWRLMDGPYFDNQVATLRVNGRDAVMQLDKTEPGEDEDRQLVCVFERALT